MRVLGGQIGWLSESLHLVDIGFAGSLAVSGRVLLVYEFENANSWKARKNPPHPDHTTKAAAARRPQPPRDGARKNTSHALAHTRPLP